MNHEFYGSKLNTVLLVILIILMVVALKIMFVNKELYLHPFTKNVQTEQPKTNPNVLNAVSPNQADLISFSITPNQTVSGLVNFTGKIKNGYFFEGNIVVNVVDNNLNILKKGNGTATSNWMTAGAVDFSGNINFTGLPQGPAYIQIHNDNASALPQNDKYVLVPIVIQ